MGVLPLVGLVVDLGAVGEACRVDDDDVLVSGVSPLVPLSLSPRGTIEKAARAGTSARASDDGLVRNAHLTPARVAAASAMGLAPN